MALILTDEQQCGLEIELLTAAGNPGKVDGLPQWSVANPSVCGIVVSPDGLSATISANGLGSTQVSVTVDADLGAGVRSLTGTLDVTVQPAEVVSIGILAGTPQTKPA